MRNKIIEAARQRIGTPFKHQGRKAGFGLDCIGLIVNVLSEFYPHISQLDEKNYSAIPYKNRLKERLDSILPVVNNPKPADILLFKYGRYPQHVGFFTGFSVIHAYAPVGKVIETSINMNDIKIVAAYDIEAYHG